MLSEEVSCEGMSGLSKYYMPMYPYVQHILFMINTSEIKV